MLQYKNHGKSNFFYNSTLSQAIMSPKMTQCAHALNDTEKKTILVTSNQINYSIFFRFSNYNNFYTKSKSNLPFIVHNTHANPYHPAFEEQQI